MFKYGMNRPIYFKLSESGHKALDRYYGDEKSIFLTHTKEINGEVYYEAPLWEFAQIFGQFMDFGYNIPVESDVYFEDML